MNELALTDFVDLDTLLEVQHAFAALTGVAISIRDPQGRAIAAGAGENEFCRRLLEHPKAAAACHESHTAAAAAACEGAEPCKHVCHAGLAIYSAPVTVNGRRLAAILVGERPPTPLTDDQVRDLARRYGMNYETLRRTAWALKHWNDREIQVAARFAQLLANTLARLCYQGYELGRRVEELSAVYRVSSLLAGERDLRTVLNLSARLVAETLKVKASAIRLVDDDTGELKIAAVHNLSDGYLRKGPLRVATSAIDAAALAGEIVYVADLPSDPRTVYKAQARTEGIRSALIAPLTYRGRTIGVMRAYAGERRVFSDFDRSLLRAVSEQAAAAIIYARMHRDAQQAEALERQVRLAGEVQRRMIPAAPPAHARLEIGCVYRPSFELGGDFYDFLEFDAGRLGVVIADVVGKGVPASLTMASVRAALRSHATCGEERPIEHVMGVLNQHICRDTPTNEFVTLFYGVIDGSARRLRYCSAGHEPVLLLRNEEVCWLRAGGLVLGINPEATYAGDEASLEEGDVLVWYTDGLIDTMNYEGESYGRARLDESLRRHARLEPGQLANQLLWDVRRFAGLAKQTDDITIVVARVR